MYFPFEKYDYDDANFLIDETHWHMVARISKDGLWRVTYGEIPGLTREELRERHAAKMKAILPGPDEWRLDNFSPYRVHQRLAPNMRVGRVCLAADAAHICNPFGGMGLTGGIVDVGGLADCLTGIYLNLADDSILDVYDTVRRQMYRDHINPNSSNWLKRMWQNPDSAFERDPVLQRFKKGESDLKVAVELQFGLNVIKYDFTQHYRGLREIERVDSHSVSEGATKTTPAHMIPAAETM